LAALESQYQGALVQDHGHVEWQSPPEPSVFTIGTDAVLLDMAARDEEVRLVLDLRAEEIDR
jgi:tRNA1(Val) A37 N6-methylase TrmN6